MEKLRVTKLIQKIEEMTNYRLDDATYVDMGQYNDGAWIDDNEKWGAKLFLKYKF
jgi:hypothetical protein